MDSNNWWKYLLAGVLFWGTFYGILGGGFTSGFFASFLYGTVWVWPLIILLAIAVIVGWFYKSKGKE